MHSLRLSPLLELPLNGIVKLKCKDMPIRPSMPSQEEPRLWHSQIRKLVYREPSHIIRTAMDKKSATFSILPLIASLFQTINSQFI